MSRPHDGHRTRLVIALLTVAVAIASCGTQAARSRRLRFGFNEGTATPAQADQLAGQVGATMRRLFANWNQVEALPGRWTWASLDAKYHDALRRGLSPLLVAGVPPCWAHPSAGCTVSHVSPPDPAYDGYWSQFVKALAARYPKAAGIEIWNEPNLTVEWSPAPDPERYRQLLTEAYVAIKRADPNMTVLSGGLSPLGIHDEAGDLPDAAFLAGVLEGAHGRVMDAIGAHPYPLVYTRAQPASEYVASMEADLDRLRAVSASAHAIRPFWVTEVGVSTATQPGFPSAVTPTEQAADLMAMLRDLRSDPDVRVVIIHTLKDAPVVGGRQIESGFGVFTADGAPKPAACAISAFARGALRC